MDCDDENSEKSHGSRDLDSCYRARGRPAAVVRQASLIAV
jgi:hypothetical protein